MQYDGRLLWLFYSVSGPPEARPARGNSSYPGGDIRLVTSDDEGVTWSAPRTLLSFKERGSVSKVTANKMAGARIYF